jgi:glutamate dehydrogenase
VATHLLVHPMLHVRRDPADELVEVLSPGHSEYGMSVEAWTQIEIDRLDPVRAERLAADVRAAVDAVHRVVADFGHMRDRLRGLAAHDPLLEWLADQQFVFLGAATYDLGPDGASCRPDSVLGQLTCESAIDPEILMDGPDVTVTRSARIATVHRPVRMTAVTVRCLDDHGRPVAQRFVGLLAATAYRESVLDIPSVGERARKVLGLAADGPGTHPGR